MNQHSLNTIYCFLIHLSTYVDIICHCKIKRCKMVHLKKTLVAVLLCMKVPGCYALCLMCNAASQLLGIWCIDLCVGLIAPLTIIILNDILTSSLRSTSRIHKHWDKLYYLYIRKYTHLFQSSVHVTETTA